MKRFAAILVILVGAASYGGYGPHEEPFSVQMRVVAGWQTWEFPGAPADEAHMGFDFPGELCFVYTSRTNRNGVVFNEVWVPIDEGDGRNFVWQYSPAMVHRIDCTAQTSEFSARPGSESYERTEKAVATKWQNIAQ